MKDFRGQTIQIPQPPRDGNAVDRRRVVGRWYTVMWIWKCSRSEEPPSHHGEETTSRNDHQGSFFGAFSPNVAPPTSSRDQCNKTTSNLFIPPTVPKEFVNRYVVDDRQGYSEAGSLTGEARQELTWLLQVIPSLMRVTILVERELRCLRK